MTSKVKLVSRVECVSCDWQPDPGRRMGFDAQAEAHTRGSGHTTVTWQEPEGTV